MLHRNLLFPPGTCPRDSLCKRPDQLQRTFQPRTVCTAPLALLLLTREALSHCQLPACYFDVSLVLSTGSIWV